MARSSQFPPSVNPGIPKEQKPPIGWKLVQFGEVLRVVERPAKLLDEHEYQLVTAKRNRGGIIPREKLIGIKILTKNQYFLMSGDFLISRRQIVHGACGIVPKSLEGAIASNEYATLLPNNDILLEYLSYYSHTPHFQQTCFHSSIGVDVEKMVFKIDDWLQHEMVLPPISEQKNICAILSSVDDAILATQAVIDQTRRVKQGLLQQLLTRGIGHTRFKQSEIGEIPEDWRIKRVDDIASVFSGGTPSRSNMDFYRGNIPWVKSGETDQEFITTTNEFITEEAIHNSSAKWAKNGDVLIAMYGATAGKVATLCIDATINQAIACVSAQPNKALNQFLHYTFQHITPLLIRKSQGSGQPNLSGQIIKSTEILIPPLPEQKKIASILRSVDETLKAEHEKLQQNITIKKGLMQDLLTGRVRVKLDEMNTT